jgi:hypothetical protein
MRKPAMEPQMMATIELCERPPLAEGAEVGGGPAAEVELTAEVDDVVELVREDGVREEGVAVMVAEVEVGMMEVGRVEEGIAGVEETVVGVAEGVKEAVVEDVVVGGVVVGAVVAGAVVDAGDDRPPYTQSGPSGICKSTISTRSRDHPDWNIHLVRNR